MRLHLSGRAIEVDPDSTARRNRRLYVLPHTRRITPIVVDLELADHGLLPLLRNKPHAERRAGHCPREMAAVVIGQ